MAFTPTPQAARCAQNVAVDCVNNANPIQEKIAQIHGALDVHYAAIGRAKDKFSLVSTPDLPTPITTPAQCGTAVSDSDALIHLKDILLKVETLTVEIDRLVSRAQC